MVSTARSPEEAWETLGRGIHDLIVGLAEANQVRPASDKAQGVETLQGLNNARAHSINSLRQAPAMNV